MIIPLTGTRIFHSALLITPSRSAFTCHFPRCIHFIANRYTTLTQVSGRITDIGVGVKCFRGLRL
jgi:poly(A) polymerase Pap1